MALFKKANIKILGIEPAFNIAKIAEEKGIPTITKFFGEDLAKKLVNEGKKADLVIGNNVLAHVPNLNDFISGLNILTPINGIITLEFPHLLKLLQNNAIVNGEICYIDDDRIIDINKLKIHSKDLNRIRSKNISIYVWCIEKTIRLLCI